MLQNTHHHIQLESYLTDPHTLSYPLILTYPLIPSHSHIPSHTLSSSHTLSYPLIPTFPLILSFILLHNLSYLLLLSLQLYTSAWGAEAIAGGAAKGGLLGNWVRFYSSVCPVLSCPASSPMSPSCTAHQSPDYIIMITFTILMTCRKELCQILTTSPPHFYTTHELI